MNDEPEAAANAVYTAARAVVMATTPFGSALEVGHGADGLALHQTLREALGISEDEWRESAAR